MKITNCKVQIIEVGFIGDGSGMMVTGNIYRGNEFLRRKYPKFRFSDRKEIGDLASVYLRRGIIISSENDWIEKRGFLNGKTIDWPESKIFLTELKEEKARKSI